MFVEGGGGNGGGAAATWGSFALANAAQDVYARFTPATTRLDRCAWADAWDARTNLHWRWRRYWCQRLRTRCLAHALAKLPGPWTLFS
eukprot:6306847-Amphidinium_carterae.1